MNNKKHTLSPADRRGIYIDYLKEHSSASTSEFLCYLKEHYNAEISRGTLSEDREKLKEFGYEFSTHKNKYMLTREPEHLKNFSHKTSQKFTSCINRDLFLDWMLLYDGQKKGTGFDKAYFAQNTAIFSDVPQRVIQEHLQQLSIEGYLTFKNQPGKNRIYRFRPSVSSVYGLSSEAVSDFCYDYETATSAVGSAASVIEPFYQFCCLLLNNELPESDNPELNTSKRFQHGRQNSFPDEINKQLEALNNLSYETRKLNLVYSSPALPEKLNILFSTGISFYSTETNQCYLLGKSERKENLLIRLDRIDFNATTNSDKLNPFYNSSDLNQIYAEMFSASLDEPEHIEVHFESFSQNIEFKVKALHRYRSVTSQIRYSEENDTIIYTDTIRGLSSFAHYLRTFGSSAKIIHPQKLRDMILSSAHQVFNSYPEL